MYRACKFWVETYLNLTSIIFSSYILSRIVTKGYFSLSVVNFNLKLIILLYCMNIRFLTWHFCNSSYEKLQHKFKDESRSRVKMYALLIFNMREYQRLWFEGSCKTSSLNIFFCLRWESVREKKKVEGLLLRQFFALSCLPGLRYWQIPCILILVNNKERSKRGFVSMRIHSLHRFKKNWFSPEFSDTYI